jgi:hypothetical protein
MVRSAMVAALVTSLLGMVFLLPESHGILQSRDSQNIQVHNGYWATTVGGAVAAPASVPYLVTWSANTKRQYALIALMNIGTFDLTKGVIAFTSAKSNGDTSNPPTLIFESCSGSWNVTSYLCSGTINVLGSATGGQFHVNQSIAANNRLVLRVTNLRDVNANYVTTFNAQTSRSDFRAAQVFSS